MLSAIQTHPCPLTPSPYSRRQLLTMAGDKGTKVSAKKSDKKADKKVEKHAGKAADKKAVKDVKAATTKAAPVTKAPAAKNGVPASSKDILAMAAKVSSV